MITRHRLEETLQNEQLAPFHELLTPELETSNLERVLELLMEENFAERGCLWLEERHELIYIGDETLRLEFPFSRRVVDSVLDRGRGFVSYDSSTDARLDPKGSVVVNNVRSCLCTAARRADGDLLAIAYFDNRASVGNFTEKDLAFLNQVMDLFPGAAPPG